MTSRNAVALFLAFCIAAKFVAFHIYDERKFRDASLGTQARQQTTMKGSNTPGQRNSPQANHDFQNRTTLPVPLQVLEQYKQWHSIEALQRDPDNRTFAMGFYSCPLQAGNRLHHFMNNLKWAIITNRTLLWKYWDEETCKNYNGDVKQFASVCDNANKVEDCDQILTRAGWLPSYDEWSQRLSLDDPHFFPWEATRLKWQSRKPQVELRGVDVVEKYPYQVAVFHMNRNKESDLMYENARNTLLHTVWGREIAQKLHSLGVDFLYGMIYRQSFQLRESFLGSYSQASTKGTFSHSFVLHSRHISENRTGCAIAQEVSCLEQLLKDADEGQQVWAAVMSDRECTIGMVRSWLEKRNVTIQTAEHRSGESYRKEHGPFAGVGYYQDVEFASQARSGFIATAQGQGLRSSSNLVLEVIEYEKHMDAWKAEQDLKEVQATKVCVLDRRPPKPKKKATPRMKNKWKMSQRG